MIYAVFRIRVRIDLALLDDPDDVSSTLPLPVCQFHYLLYIYKRRTYWHAAIKVVPRLENYLPLFRMNKI